MKSIKIGICTFLLIQAACQRQQGHEQFDSANISHSFATSETLKNNVESLNPSTKQSSLVNYEAAMLNAYADVETRNVFKDILIRAAEPNIAGGPSQLNKIQEDTKAYILANEKLIPAEISQVQEISTRYQKEVQKIEEDFGFKREALRNLDYVGTAGSTVIGATGAGLPVAVAVEITKNFVIDSLQSHIDVLEKEVRSKASQVVVGAIKNMNMQEMQDLAKLDMQDPVKAKTQAQSLLQSYTSSLIPNGLSAEEQTALTSALGKRFGEEAYSLLIQHKTVQNIRNQKQDQINETVVGNLIAVTRTFETFKSQTSQNVQNLFKNQAEINKFIKAQSAEISNITKSLQETETRTKFLAEFVYGKMTAAEQIAALKSGSFGSPNSPAVLDLLAQKEQIVQKEKQMAELRDFIKGLQGVAQLASTLGVDKELTNTLSKGAIYANAAMNAASLLSKSDYIGAALAVTGVFGGADVEGARFEQIMNQLRKMDVKLDRVLELQQQTIDMIKQVAVQIQQSTLFLSNRLYSVQYLQLTMNETIESILNKELNSCHIIRAAIQREYNGNQADFLLNLKISDANALSTCSETMNTRFFVDKMAPKYYLSTFLKVADISAPEKLEQDYKNLLKYVSVKSPDLVKKVNASLLLPVKNYRSLLNKLNQIIPSGSESTLSDRRLHPLAIVADVNFLTYLLPTLTIYHNIRSPDDILSAANTKMGYRQYQMLTTALEWLNRGIMQESLLSGDAVLEMLYLDRANINAPVSCGLESDKLATPYCLIKHNSMLRYNYVIYMLRKGLESQGASVNALMSSIEMHEKGSQDPATNFLGHSLDFKYNEQGKISGIIIAGEVVDISVLEDANSGTLLINPVVNSMLEARDRVTQKMTEMRANTFLTENQRRYLNSKVFSP